MMGDPMHNSADVAFLKARNVTTLVSITVQSPNVQIEVSVSIQMRTVLFFHCQVICNKMSYCTQAKNEQVSIVKCMYKTNKQIFKIIVNDTVNRGVPRAGTRPSLSTMSRGTVNSDRAWQWYEDRAPRKHMTADLMREKLRQQ